MAKLTDQEKEKIEKLRRRTGIKNMYYTRYFLIRYVVAFYFFINLYWTLMLFLSEQATMVILPILLMAYGAVCMWEQFRMFSDEPKVASHTYRFMQITVIVNAVLLLLTTFNQYHYFFPFFAVNGTVKMIVMGMLLLGILLAVWMMSKLRRINRNGDKQYIRIQRYLESIKV